MPDNPTIMSTLNATLAFDYGVEIDPTLVSKVPFDSPIFDRILGLGDVQNNQLAAIYGLFTAADFTAGGDGSFTPGGDPPYMSFNREIHSVPKKSYGAAGGLKDINIIASSMGITPHRLAGGSLAAGNMQFANDAELLINLLYVKTRQALDWGSVRGDTSVNPNNMNGLQKMITVGNGSQIVDMAGLPFDGGYLNELIINMTVKGITPTAIYCNPIFKPGIYNYYMAGQNVQVNMQMGDGAVNVGNWGNSVITPAGLLPIVTDRRFTVSGSAPTFTGDIFVMCENYEGEKILYYDWQVRPTALDLARVPGFYTSQVFAVWSHLVLVDKSEWFAQGRMTNVTTTYRLTPPKPTV